MLSIGCRDNSGSAYVLFGSDGATSFAELDLATFTSGSSTGVLIFGASSISPRNAGDINGDGITDLVMCSLYDGTIGRVNSGTAYILYGHTSAFAGVELPLITTSASTGFRVFGAVAQDQFCTGSVGVLDVNGDGTDDILLGGTSSDDLRSNSGSAYVIYGVGPPTATPTQAPTGPSRNPTLSPTKTPTRTPTAQPSAKPTAVPTRLPTTNPTVLPTFAPTSPTRTPTYVPTQPTAKPTCMPTAPTAMPSLYPLGDIDLSGFSSGSVGYKLVSPSGASLFGANSQPVGDFNGDGYADMIFGAEALDKAYVVFGRLGNVLSDLDMATFTSSATTGFIASGAASGDTFGRSVDGAGDMNGDGYDDVMASAYFATYSGRTRAGGVYVIFGHSNEQVSR